MTDITKIESDLRNLDLGRLAEFDARIDGMITGMNTLNAPMYLRDFAMAFDASNSMLAKATRALGKAQIALKNAESVAYFDGAPEFLAARGVKDTVEARKQYVPMDTEVQKASEIVSMAESVVGFLKNKLQVYRFAHDDVKKSAYYQDNSNHDV